jgi:hypothetical protein
MTSLGTTRQTTGAFKKPYENGGAGRSTGGMVAPVGARTIGCPNREIQLGDCSPWNKISRATLHGFDVPGSLL